MAINKIMDDFETAVSGVKDGSTILVSGFGGAGMPTELLNALRRQGATDLTIVSNNAGVGREGIGGLLSEGKVKKVYWSKKIHLRYRSQIGSSRLSSGPVFFFCDST